LACGQELQPQFYAFASGAVTFGPAIPYSWQVSRIGPGKPDRSRRKGDS
jgi:hypothetical protein